QAVFQCMLQGKGYRGQRLPGASRGGQAEHALSVLTPLPTSLQNTIARPVDRAQRGSTRRRVRLLLLHVGVETFLQFGEAVARRSVSQLPAAPPLLVERFRIEEVGINQGRVQYAHPEFETP